MSNMKILLMILIPAGITFLLRLMPFVLFGGKRRMSPMVAYLGEVLPYTVMAALVVYCLKGLTAGLSGDGIITIAASLVVVLVHLWRKNTILSITAGTLCYMVLLRM